MTRALICRTGGLALIACLAMFASGCKPSRISGKVLNNGEDRPLGEKESMTLLLISEGSDAKTYTANVAKDGTFTFAEAVPNGPYRLAIYAMGDYSQQMKDAASRYQGVSMGAMRGVPDQLGGKFAPTRTPLRVEISGGARLTIDVGKAEVKTE